MDQYLRLLPVYQSNRQLHDVICRNHRASVPFEFDWLVEWNRIKDQPEQDELRTIVMKPQSKEAEESQLKCLREHYGYLG